MLYLESVTASIKCKCTSWSCHENQKKKKTSNAPVLTNWLYTIPPLCKYIPQLGHRQWRQVLGGARVSHGKLIVLLCPRSPEGTCHQGNFLGSSKSKLGFPQVGLDDKKVSDKGTMVGYANTHFQASVTPAIAGKTSFPKRETPSTMVQGKSPDFTPSLSRKQEISQFVFMRRLSASLQLKVKRMSSSSQPSGAHRIC